MGASNITGNKGMKQNLLCVNLSSYSPQEVFRKHYQSFTILKKVLVSIITQKFKNKNKHNPLELQNGKDIAGEGKFDNGIICTSPSPPPKKWQMKHQYKKCMWRGWETWILQNGQSYQIKWNVLKYSFSISSNSVTFKKEMELQEKTPIKSLSLRHTQP